MEYVPDTALARGPGRPCPRPFSIGQLWATALLLLGAAHPALSGFSGPTFPHKEGGKTPGPGPSGVAALPGLSTVTSPPPWPATTAAPGPSFDTSDIPTTITARPGQTVFLPCRVRNRGDYVVLWMRTWPIQVLTHGEMVFASSLRFSVWHGGGGDAWTLKLTGARPEDSGRYECQVNTDPKMSLGIALQVAEDIQDFPSDQQHVDAPAPTPDDGSAMLAGPRLVNRGTTVTFNCVADAPAPGDAAAINTATVEWLYNGQLMNVQSSRGGISVETERDEQKIRSRLTVASVSDADAGTYTCAPAGARPDSILLIVGDGERTEAMHRGAGPRAVASQALSVVAVVVTFLSRRYRAC